jgi:hypothetical protein
MLLMTACLTNQKNNFVYDVPDVTFPTFPPPDCVTFDEETGTVSLPLWYWLLIANYKIDVDAIEQYFNSLRKLQRERLGIKETQ